MDIQRLRNLTTGILHTEMSHIYEDLGSLLNTRGLMTHMLPDALKTARPYLRKHIKDPHFWDGTWDTKHTGELVLPNPTVEEVEEMYNTLRVNLRR